MYSESRDKIFRSHFVFGEKRGRGVGSKTPNCEKTTKSTLEAGRVIAREQATRKEGRSSYG